jgi:hypothetical protein
MGSRITRAEFARRAKVNRSTITRWIESGRLTLGADGLLDEAEAHRQRAASESPQPHHQARKAQLDLEKTATRPAGAAARALVATTTPTASDPTGGDPASASGAGFGGGAGGAGVVPIGAGPGHLDQDEVVRRTRRAQMLEREAIARMKEREDQEAAGQVLRRAAVERAATDAVAVILNAAETIPDRLAPLLVGIEDQARIRALLRDEIEQFLARASAELERVAEAQS